MLPAPLSCLDFAGNDAEVEGYQLKVVHGLAFLLSAAEQELSAACRSGLQLGMPLIQQAAAFSKQCRAFELP